MASLGHLAVGMATGRLLSTRLAPGTRPGRAMLWLAALSMLPDADVVGFALGIHYQDPLGHRGATHSIVFALVIGLVAVVMARPLGFEKPLRLGATVGLLILSHPLLDMLTDGGLGCALFWPLSDRRLFFPITPIPVAPIGTGMLSRRGLVVVAIELLAFAPFVLFALWPQKARAP